MRKLLALTLTIFAISACSESARDPIECPAGTVRVEARCVSEGTDAAISDTGTATITGDAGVLADGGKEGDGGERDAGELPREVVLSRAALDFGRSVVGEEHLQTVEAFNNTGATAIVRVGLISGSQGTDYAVTSSDPITPSGIMLEAGATVTFTFAFNARATGVREASLAFELCDEGCPATVTLRGEGILDAIVCGPANLDFGEVNPNSCVTEAIQCVNDSSYDATITRAIIAAGSTFSLSSVATFPILVPAAGQAGIDVLYCPTALLADTGSLEITVAHPDPQRTTQVITLAGTGGGPDLSCSPLSIDFGVLSTIQSGERVVTCQNIGTSALNLGSIAFSAASAPELSVTGTFPNSLAPLAYADIRLIYDPQAPGAHHGVLEIASSDRDTPVLSIEVLATALDTTGCEITATPAELDFGAVRIGTAAHAVVHFENTGTNDCGFNLYGLSQGTGTEFVLVTPAQSMVLAPSAGFDVELQLTPAAAVAYTAELGMSTTEPMFPGPFVISGAGIDSTYPISATPSTLDFGTTRFGCSDPAQRPISITNSGAAISVTLEIESPSPAWTINGLSTRTVTVPANSTLEVPIGFQPTNAATYFNRVRLTPANQPSIYVALAGAADAIGRTVQTFSAPGAQVIDMLLVVDDSGSMAEEQAALAAVAATLIARADASGADYHLAVTTTDPGDFAPIAAGTLRGNPAVITSQSATRIADLQAAINQGTAGSANETGLLTAAEAVTNAGLLAGANAGFLRPNGELVIVVLTDEQDYSTGTVESYVNRILSRPIGLPGARMYSISGGPTGCNGIGGNADPATRYLEAIALLGGFDRSICDADYTQSITEIADAAFLGSRAVFQLGSPPAPGTLEVYVDNVLAPASSFGINYTEGQVIFGSGQQPDANAVVRVEYDAFCVSATCGNGSTQPSEQCDDGNPTDTDACPNTCYNAFCGDGFVRAIGEQCDDGNTVTGDGCNSTCVVEGCGNGIVETPETCDDGASNSDTAPNACRTSCALPSCGDAVSDTGEDCDDGNTNQNDACLESCVVASCGDGFVRTNVEECDDGNLIDTDLCDSTCSFTFPSFSVTVVPNSPLVPSMGTALNWGADGGDEAIVTQAIGFPFNFLGAAVTDVYVVSNGYLAFELPSAATYSNASIPNATEPNAFVAWWWDDLDFASARMSVQGTATTQLTGSSPNRVRTFTFLNVARYGFNADGTVLNAEVRLYEGSNVIEVHYGTTAETTALPTVFNATAGWESTAGATGAHSIGCGSVCATANWPTSTIHRYVP